MTNFDLMVNSWIYTKVNRLIKITTQRRITMSDTQELKELILDLKNQLQNQLQLHSQQLQLHSQKVEMELKSVRTELKTLEDKTDNELKRLNDKFDIKFEALEKTVDIRFKALENKVDDKFNGWEKRLERAELVGNASVTAIFIGVAGALAKFVFFNN